MHKSAALSHPISRAIIVHLVGGPCSIVWLAARLAVSARALAKHLAVLQRSGLIARWKVGRVHYCRLAAEPLERAGTWMAHHQAFWECQLDALALYVDEEETT
jgi:DNA-binding transcriptional ArsR family regulator